MCEAGAAVAADRQAAQALACHFAGEIGQHPVQPVTSRLLGVDDQGNPDSGAGPATELIEQPGFADTWFDIKGRGA